MISNEKNFAYIDGANLDKGVLSLGWRLDYRRFRVWLKDKYGIDQAYIFLGLVPEFKDLYTHLQEAGFTLLKTAVVKWFAHEEVPWSLIVNDPNLS